MRERITPLRGILVALQVLVLSSCRTSSPIVADHDVNPPATTTRVESHLRKSELLCPAGLERWVTTLAYLGMFATDHEFDAAGNLIVSVAEDNRIYKIDPNGFVSVLAGSGATQYVPGYGQEASFYHPHGMAVHKASNTIYFADDLDRILKMSADGYVSIFAGGGDEEVKDGPSGVARFRPISTRLVHNHSV